jgi:hypothetical protein
MVMVMVILQRTEPWAEDCPVTLRGGTSGIPTVDAGLPCKKTMLLIHPGDA